MILKHPDILTVPEQDKLNRLRDIMMFGVTAGIMAMPYSVYLGMKARRNPSLRNSYVKKMAIIPTIPLAVLVISGYYSN